MDGMMSFDQSLFTLYKDGVITKEDALRFAESRTDLSLQMRLSESGGSTVPSSTSSKPKGQPSFNTKL